MAGGETLIAGLPWRNDTVHAGAVRNDSRTVTGEDRGARCHNLCSDHEPECHERMAVATFKPAATPPDRSVASVRIRSRLAAVVCGIAIFFGIGAMVYILVPPRVGAPGAGLSALQFLADGAFVTVTPALGCVLVRRRPENGIGWLFIGIAFWLGLGFFTDGLARHEPPTLVVGWIATLGSAFGSLGFVGLFLLLQVFPTGHLPSARWHWLPRVTVFGGLLNVASLLFSGRPLDPDVADLPKPLSRPDLLPIVDVLNGIATLILLLSLIGTVTVVIVGFRRSRGVERQQRKWFAWASSIVAGLIATAIATGPLGDISDTFWALALGALVLIPVASFVAILRYRLWEIDRLVSRTVSYAAVTAALVVVFALVNLGLQALLEDVTRGGTLPVAGSTLAVFAIFQPLRRRTQGFVDRRFDRARVDAERIAAAFAEHLRDQVELANITTETTTTIESSLHPSFAGLWLRGGAGPR
jgi:hypothetical protein